MAKGDRRNRGKGSGRGPGRPRKDGPRDNNDRIIPEGKRVQPADHIIARRKLFSFVADGNIDQDVCDGIGQFHALGLLDGYPIDGLELRNIGREWRDYYLTVLAGLASHAAGGERVDHRRDYARHVLGAGTLTAWETARFDALDSALTGHERSVLMDLLVESEAGSWPLGEELSPWVRAIIAEGLLKRKRVVQFARFPDANDYALLEASIRGLFSLYDAGLPSRREITRRAA